MNILVLSKKEAVKLSYKEFDRSVYAISIHSNYEYPARLHLQQSHVLSLCFDDIDGEYPTAISKEDADKIAGFVLNRIPGDARLLIVHCEAGQSRSAGVAAAIYIKSVGGQPWRGSLMAPFFVGWRTGGICTILPTQYLPGCNFLLRQPATSKGLYFP